MTKWWYILIANWLLIAACSSENSTMDTYSDLDPEKFSGQWYEVAYINLTGKEDCQCKVYNYLPMQDGGFRLLKRCKEEDGSWSNEKGKAWPMEGNDHSRLEVEYQWPFTGALYIFSVSEDYSYALAGNPDGMKMQVLAREQSLAPPILSDLKKEAHQLGYDTARFHLKDASCKY